MYKGQYRALPCLISRAGFSSERMFSLKPIGLDHEGGTYRGHLWNADESHVSDEEMPLGKEVPGFVAARILKLVGENVVVSIPDESVVTVPVTALRKLPPSDKIKEYGYVLD